MTSDRSKSIEWKLVQRDHVVRAAALIRSGQLSRPVRGKGLFVVVDSHRLPAKDVARIAYLLATGRPPDAYLDFASGQSTLAMFARLGFSVDRTPVPGRR